MELRRAGFLDLLEGSDAGVYWGLVESCQHLNKDRALKFQHHLGFLEPCDKKCPIWAIPNCHSGGTNTGAVHRTNGGLRKRLHKHLPSERGENEKCYTSVWGQKNSWQVSAVQDHVVILALSYMHWKVTGKLKAPGQHQEILQILSNWPVKPAATRQIMACFLVDDAEAVSGAGADPALL